MEYKRSKQKFISNGVELNTPVDLQPPGKYPLLKNVRSYQQGTLNSRVGMVKINQGALGDLNIHTIARMNDYLSTDFIRFVGAESNLYAGQSSFVSIASGMAASAYSIIPYRPEQSSRDWAYVMSAPKSLKVDADLIVRKIGVKPPTVPPQAELLYPKWTSEPIIQLGWVADGSAGEPVHEDKLLGCASGTVIPDGGNSLWESVIPDVTGPFWDIGQYDLLWIGGNGVPCEELHHIPAPTNEAGVVSSVAINGISSVQPDKNIKNLKRNSVLVVGGSYNRVIAINKDSSQVNSFQFYGGAVGGSLAAPTTSFRVPAGTGSGAIEFPTIGTTVTGTEVGKITSKAGLPGYNLGSIADGTFGPQDYFTFSILVSDLTKLDNIKLVMDTDPNTDGTTPSDLVGKKNALYMQMTPDDFDGNNSWKNFRVRIDSLIRVGTDDSCSLDSITAVQLIITPSIDSQSTDTLDVKLGSLYTSGSYGPDTATNLTPYQYRYRYRASETGAKSNPGPATASGIFAQRQGIHLNVTSSDDPQVDKIDIERFGGLNLEWHYITTLPNFVTTYVDGATDTEILASPALEVDRFETFPVVLPPYSGTANCAGVYVELASGANYNPNWARGSEVTVNGVLTSLASSPIGNKLIVNDSLGGQQGVEIDLPEPVQAGTPLPVMWGPFYECLFGCQDHLAPGTVYFTNPSDPDSAADINTLEITTPSERMMNGCMFDGHCYCWSDMRMFGIIPINNPNTPEFKFQYTEVPTARGLFATWAFAVGPKIWYLSADGIYESDGGTCICITDDIEPLFPKGDRPGFAVRGLKPVLMTYPGGISADSNLRLAYHNGFLYFDYQDTDIIHRTLVYDIANKAWYPDTYFEETSNHGVNCRFSESGSVDGDEADDILCGTNFGFLAITGSQSNGSNNDFGDPIRCIVDTPAMDFGDPRAKKIYGELTYELNTSTINVTSTPYIDSYGTALPSKVFVNNVQQVLPPQDLAEGIGVFARNIGAHLTWQSSTQIVGLYGYEFSYLERPEDTFLRADDWNDAGFDGSKFVTGFLVDADTMGVDKTVCLEIDQQVIETYEMNHAGQTVHVYSVKPQFIGTLLRLRPLEAVAWREFKVSWIFEKYPELSDLVTQYEDGGFQGAKLMRGVDIEALGGPAETLVEIDGGTTAYTLELDHTGITALHTKPYAFRKPFIATELRLNPASAIRLGKRRWIFDPYPDLSPLITPYTDGGYDGAKFVQGLKLEAAGSTTIRAEYDGDQVGPSFTADHTDSDGVGVLITKAYSFPTPFIGHDLRLSTAGNTSNMRIGKITWVYEPAPELVYNWVTQGTSHGIPGYMFLKDGYIAHQSTSDITLTVILEGAGEVYTFLIPHSSGIYKKSYVLLGTGVTRTLKDKLFKYRLDSAQPFRLFERDCEVRVHAWDGGQYVVTRPFGDVPSEDGAKI